MFAYRFSNAYVHLSHVCVHCVFEMYVFDMSGYMRMCVFFFKNNSETFTFWQLVSLPGGAQTAYIKYMFMHFINMTNMIAL